MKFTEVRASGYNAIPTDSVAHKIRLIDAQKYIDRIASVASVDISDWDLSVFNNPDSSIGGIYTDKNKINECFFQHLEKLKAPEPPPVSNIPPELLSAVKTHAVSITARQKSILIDQKHALERNLRDSSIEQQNLIRDIRKTAMAISTANKADAGEIVKHVDKILAGGFWKLDKYDFGVGYYGFHTPPITLFYANALQASQVTVPMGSFKVVLYWDDRGVSAYQHRDNVRYQDWIHPHISSEGKICFGTMEGDYLTAVQTRDYSTIMELTKTVLSKYWNDSPFQYLHRFRDAYEAGGTINEQEEEEEQEEEPDDDAEESRPPTPGTLGGFLDEDSATTITGITRNDAQPPLNYTLSYSGPSTGGR